MTARYCRQQAGYNLPSAPPEYLTRPLANLYHLPELPQPGSTVLSGDVAHHLLRVLRVRIGATLQLGNGRGQTAQATVTGVNKATLTVDLAPLVSHIQTTPSITLAFAVPRRARADWLFEHATEVGVTCLQPLLTERSRPQGLRPDRWRKIVGAAAGQCGRAWLPTVRDPVDLSALLGGELPETRLLADADGLAVPHQSGAQSSRDPLSSGALLSGAQQADAYETAGPREVIALIGPEGGFTASERAAACSAGFQPTRFGPHILRTETAALVAAAILLSGS